MNKLAGGLAALSAFAAATSAAAAPVLWDVAAGGNGHYYEVAGNPATPSNPSPGLTWSDALADAASRSYLGRQGYLVTITSAAEDAFLAALFRYTFWAGGSDAETEGVWKWVAGPEAGQVFWNVATVTYANWGPGHPASGGDGLLAGNYADRKWSDPIAYGYNPTDLYIVEYGGLETGAVPEPATWAMMILGLGAAGAVIRRRRAGLATA